MAEQRPEPPINLDPNLTALIDRLVRDRLQEVEQSHQQEIMIRDDALQAQQHESQILRGQLEALQNQLVAFHVHSGNHAFVDQDTPMDSIQPAQKATLPQMATAALPQANSKNPNPQSKGRRTRKPTPPVPETAPSRNLRNRTATTSKVSEIPISAQRQSLPTTHVSEVPVNTKTIPKPATHKHRLLRRELPDDIMGLQTAMSLHIRILWGLLDPKDIPRDPPVDVIEQFALHCSSEEQLYGFRNPSSRELISPTLVKLGTSASVTKRGKLATQVRLVEEHMIQYIQSYLARFGLLRWWPDLRQSAYSLFNSACRIVAIDTFKQALVVHTYAHVQPNKSYVNNISLLVKLYDHIVHHYHFMRYQRESRNPGCVKAADDANPTYHGRKRLADARLEFLKANRYPQRYCDLIDPKATSDDEVDADGRKVNGRKIFWIKKRKERSTAAEFFLRTLDRKRDEEALLDPTKRRRRERIRLVPESNQKDTDFPAVPSGLPIDYYDPDFFNSLQPNTRHRISTRKIALLPEVTASFTSHPDEKLSDVDFTEKYGPLVWIKYSLDDLNSFEDEAGDWLDDDEMDFDYSPEDDDDSSGNVGDHQSALVAHLSSESV